MQSVPITTNVLISSPTQAGVLDTILCFVSELWFSSCTPVSPTNNTDHNVIDEILLKVALNTIKQNQSNSNAFSFELKSPTTDVPLFVGKTK